MQRQTYADNVDSNGVAYKTVGDNIREGAKDAKSVVKALQSEDITFDMQAIMNVLPFMDSTKKIIEINISPLNSIWHADKHEGSPSAYGVGVNVPCYGCLIGEIKRYNLTDPTKLAFNLISLPNGSNHIYIKFLGGLTSTDTGTGTNIKLYIVTDKTIKG